VHLARGSDPYICLLLSKCISRGVVVLPCNRWLVGEAGDPAGKIHWACTRPSAKSLPADAKGRAGVRGNYRMTLND